MNVLQQSEENVSMRYPHLARYKDLHAEVEAMKPAAIVAVLTSLGAALSGGNMESNLILVFAAIVWVARWGFIKVNQKKFSGLVYEEVARLTNNFTDEKGDKK